MYPSRFKEWHNHIYDAYWSHHRQQGYFKNKAQTLSLLALAILSKIFGKENLYDGGWYGNETIPRTTIDLNHILYFYDLKNQKMSDTQTRTVFHVIDGIIAGWMEAQGKIRAKMH